MDSDTARMDGHAIAATWSSSPPPEHATQGGGRLLRQYAAVGRPTTNDLRADFTFHSCRVGIPALQIEMATVLGKTVLPQVAICRLGRWHNTAATEILTTRPAIPQKLMTRLRRLQVALSIRRRSSRLKYFRRCSRVNAYAT